MLASIMSIAVIFTSFGSIVLAIVIAFKMSRLTTKVDVENYEKKFGSLTEQLKQRKFSALLLTVFDQLRTILTVSVLVWMRDFPGIQVVILLQVS